MAHSVEARMPFLDYRLVSMVYRSVRMDGSGRGNVPSSAGGDARLHPGIPCGRAPKDGFSRAGRTVVQH